MTVHDFTNKRIKRKDEDALLYNTIYGSKAGIKRHDIIHLDYKSRKTSYLIIDIDYNDPARPRRFTAIIIFLEFIS